MRRILISLPLLLAHLLQFLEKLFRSLRLLLLTWRILRLRRRRLNWLYRCVLRFAGIHLLFGIVIFFFAFLAGVRLRLLLLHSPDGPGPALWGHDHPLDD